MTLYKQPPAAPQTRLIGNERVGIIEVPVLGGLTIEEDETIAELTDKGSSVMVLASRKAQAIELAEKISLVEAYRILEDAVCAKPQEEAARVIALRHAEAVSEVRTAWTEAGSLNRRATVTALLRHRLGVPEIPQGFPRVLFNALADLAEEEQAAENLPPQPVTAEALGKPPEAKSSGKRRTGARSSGS
jgi:hypothetical protein